MATYTPKEIVAPALLGTTAGTSVFTGTGAHTYVIRTIEAQANSASKTFTMSLGADAQGTRLFDAYALTANVPSIFNGWWVFPGAGAHDIDANASAATAVSLGVYGYDVT